MKKMFIIAGLFVIFGYIQQAKAADIHKELKKYFNDIAVKVKNTSNTERKREILNDSFKKMMTALDEVEHTPLSENDIQSLKSFKKQLKLKYNELNGIDGFEKVSNNNLNNFADYSVQDLEPSAEYVTISVLTLVLIIIAAALLL
ncbi:MAG: hypothetical protein WCE54_12490 [Ignavibacteriaceae bacterium]